MTTDKRILKTHVTSLYQIQKLRIQLGNRVCAAFRDKLGLEPSQPEKEEAQAAAILKILRQECKLVTDGVVKVTLKLDNKSKILTELSEIRLIEGYEQLLATEETHKKAVEDELKKFPIWTQWLKGVKGVGPLMAGVIISSIDIHKAHHPSSLWVYAGIDVVMVMDEETLELTGEGRCKKKHHLVPKTYTKRNGETVDTFGISYNDFLKSKMLGVLGSSFIRCAGGCHYRDIYIEHKFWLQSHPEHKKLTKMHIHNRARRFMIKEFFCDLYEKWRTLEGLEVLPRYSEAKLGIEHKAYLKEAA